MGRLLLAAEFTVRIQVLVVVQAARLFTDQQVQV